MSPLTSLLIDAGFAIPRKGWPGRRRAIALAWLTVIVQAVLFLLLMAAMYGAVLLAAAGMDAL